MRDSGVRGGGARDAAGPGDLGWDDSLYQDLDGAGAGSGAGSRTSSGAGTATGAVTDPGLAPDSGEPAIPGQRNGGTGGGANGDNGSGDRRGGSRRQPRSRKRRIFRWMAGTMSLLILAGAGAGYAYYEYLAGKIRTGELNSGKSDVAPSRANAAGETPLNILVLGSDARDSEANMQLGGARNTAGEPPRADVIMLLHISADRSNMSVVSIPRDTRVPIPECTDAATGKTFKATDHDIINESLGRGGAGCTRAAVQNLTGVYIDHWMTVDFAGVVKMADAVGDVEVCVKQNIWDHPTKAQPGGSGLKMKAGTWPVKGQQALQWLRTRHAFGDDAGRSKAQHMYMNSMMRNLQNQSLFTNPARLNGLATKAMEAFQVSKEIGTPKKLYGLGMELKSVPPGRMTMMTMPHDADPENPDAHYVPAKADASKVWTLLRNDVAMDTNGKGANAPKAAAKTGPPAAAPAAIAVTVVNGTAGDKNGTSVENRASTVSKALVTGGFTKAKAATTGKPSKGTLVNYPASAGEQGKSDALAVAAALKIPSAAVRAAADVTAVTVTVGADWTSGTDYGKTAPGAGSVPTTADALNGSDKGCMDVYKPYQWK
ncbi:LCP family protein [Streptomyces sp. H10-C2]|uniref:LCP family protein n=1 Tax=unclassified Streptomyces TaxID=2593676 RepID=UPI0024BAC199|nr:MULTISPECIES: LCP family protein [unclassified Streptomyces]MDJ0341267.1 LCP family protein [Streptomyces sp. PH10-H1]MDJ0370862.1 LCP family protein [Streptomyces sp. H10-C2]